MKSENSPSYHFYVFTQKCQFRLENTKRKISRNSAYVLRESDADIEQCGASEIIKIVLVQTHLLPDVDKIFLFKMVFLIEFNQL